MKGLKSFIPLIVVGVIVYNIFVDKQTQSPINDDNPQRVLSESFSSFGQRGAEGGWPTIEEGFSQVSDNVVAANYYLILDGSGSMLDAGCSNGREKISVAVESIKAFIDKIPQNANVGIFAFDRQGIGERLPLGQHSSQQIVQVLDSIAAGGGTPLSLALQAGNAALTNQAKSQLGYGEYHLVVVTDGEANSGFEPDQEVRNLLAGSPIVLHTVGFCIDDYHSLNQPGYTLYKAANDPAALAAGLDAVLAEAPDFSVADFSSGEG